MCSEDDPTSQLCVNLRSPTVVRDNLCFNDAITGRKFIVGMPDAYADPVASFIGVDRVAMRAAANGRQDPHVEVTVVRGPDSHPQEIMHRTGDVAAPEKVAVFCHPHNTEPIAAYVRFPPRRANTCPAARLRGQRGATAMPKRG